MKKSVFLLCAVTGILAFGLGEALADPVINISGTAEFNKTNFTHGPEQIATTLNESFNNLAIYNLISNAVAGVTNYDSAIAPTNLPAFGYIACNLSNTTAISFPTYDTNITYSEVVGLFYVTNRSGFYYPLSGVDTNGNYYSFMELDTYDNQYGQLGFGYDFDNLTSYNYNTNSGSGPETDTETALLYIHDNPESYDDADYPEEFIYNTNAVEIRGVLKLNLNFKAGNVNSGGGLLYGTGNLGINQSYGVVLNGNARLQ
jgi:hypothetical protein